MTIHVKDLHITFARLLECHVARPRGMLRYEGMTGPGRGKGEGFQEALHLLGERQGAEVDDCGDHTSLSQRLLQFFR